MQSRERLEINRHFSPLLKDVFVRVEEFIHNNPVVVEMATPEKSALGFRRTANQDSDFATQASPSAPESFESRLFKEMKSFLPTSSVELGPNQKGEQVIAHIGSTVAYDPHTYLTLPTGQVMTAYRQAFDDVFSESTGLNSDELTANGLADGWDADFLPLHGLSWLILQVGERYLPIDALGLLSRSGALEDLVISPAKLEEKLKRVLDLSDKYTHINAVALFQLYERQILPKMVEVARELKADGVISSRVTDAMIWQGLSQVDKGNTRFMNIGHHLTTQQLDNFDLEWPPSGRDELGTGRGPASIFTAHTFLRIVPYKKILRLLDVDGKFSQEQQVAIVDLFITKLLAKIHGWSPPAGQRVFTSHEPIAFSATNLEKMAKSLDPFGHWEAEAMLRQMQRPLETVFKKIDPSLESRRIQDISSEEKPYNRSIVAMSFTFSEYTAPADILLSLSQVMQDIKHMRYQTLSQLEYGVALEANGDWESKLRAYQPTKLSEQLSTQDVRKLLKLFFLRSILARCQELPLNTLGSSEIENQLYIDLLQSYLENNENIDDVVRQRLLQEIATDLPVVHRVLWSLRRLIFVGGSNFDKIRATQVMVAQFLEVERLGLLSRKRRPLNVSLLPGFLFSYNYIHDYCKDGVRRKRLHVVISPIGGEAASVEHVKGLMVKRVRDQY